MKKLVLFVFAFLLLSLPLFPADSFLYDNIGWDKSKKEVKAIIAKKGLKMLRDAPDGIYYKMKTYMGFPAFSLGVITHKKTIEFYNISFNFKKDSDIKDNLIRVKDALVKLYGTPKADFDLTSTMLEGYSWVAKDKSTINLYMTESYIIYLDYCNPDWLN